MLWNDSINQAPAIATNMYRVHDGRIDQLGYSWLKDGFWRGQREQLRHLPTTSCNTLGIGCADTYSAGLNDGASGVSKFQINPVTGAWPSGSWSGPTGTLPLRGRLQTRVAEIADASSTYVSESIYISEDDQMAGKRRNNVSLAGVPLQLGLGHPEPGLDPHVRPSDLRLEGPLPDVHVR